MSVEFTPANNVDWFRANKFYEPWCPEPSDVCTYLSSVATSWQNPSWMTTEWEENPEIFLRVTTLFMRKYWYAAYIVAILYCFCVHSWGPKFVDWYFENDKRVKEGQAKQYFDLKLPLKYWNLFLTIFSFIGLVRCGPYLIGILYELGFSTFTCCRANVISGNGAASVWLYFFVWSKYFELIDTAFLTLRGKPVSFLHWYHHATVLAFCWHSVVWESPTGLIFCVMNYFVHSIMYFYYYLMAEGIKVSWGKCVTVMQILQMVFGIATIVAQVYLKCTVKNADAPLQNMVFAVIIYGSYLVLFCNFFVQRYLVKREAAKTAVADKKKA
jgi:hypothetical protein